MDLVNKSVLDICLFSMSSSTIGGVMAFNQNCSSAPEKSHFTSVHVPAIVYKGVHDIKNCHHFEFVFRLQ